MKEFYKNLFNIYAGAAIIALTSAGIVMTRFFLGNLNIEKTIFFTIVLFIIGIYSAVKSLWFYKKMREYK